MKAKAILFFAICTLVFGCGKDKFTSKANFSITNKSSGIIREGVIKIITYPDRSIDAITLSGLAINKTETGVIDLSSHNIKTDGSYRATILLADGTKLEKDFGYFTNGTELNTEGYNIEVLSNQIILK